MSDRPETDIRRRWWKPIPFFLSAMLLYLCVAHVWGVGIHPLGRDYERLAHPDRLPQFSRQVITAETAVFGAWAPGYHIVNLLLLYVCMVAVFFLVRCALMGPWWLGSLAATLMMLNPVKNGAVLHLSGAADLLPAVFALGALAFYAAHARIGRTWAYALALGFFAMAVLPFGVNLPLVLLILLFEALIPASGRRNWPRVLPFAMLAAAGLAIHWSALSAGSFDIAGMFAPLFLIVYPIGLLPETMLLFREHSWLAWLYGLAGTLVLALICRKTRDRTLLFGLLAAAAARISLGDRPVDPVHLIGGGQLMVPAALLALAFSAFCRRVMRHPKWVKPTVLLTTLLCLLFFALQWRSIAAWRHPDLEAQPPSAERNEGSSG